MFSGGVKNDLVQSAATLLSRRYFQLGLGVRFLTAPFLLQWFHPDERQLLEFAHFHAHGRLHPFLESQLHLRNQTLPWIFSFLIRICDFLHLADPRFYLFFFQILIGTCTWIILSLLVENFRKMNPERDSLADLLGYIFGLGWIFPWIYSRGLLEVVSFIPAGLLYLSSQGKPRRPWLSGFWAGCTSFLRYPSALWSLGAAGIWIQRLRMEKAPPPVWVKAVIQGMAGFLIALFLGGLADYFTYGSLLASAPAYWNFNRPNGPVTHAFGTDSLWVYYRWFEYALTPWLAPVFIFAALYALARNRALLFFTLPYLLGHGWTPHREPRFMIPLFPFLVLAIFQSIANGDYGRHWPIWHMKAVRTLAALLVILHVFLNFLLYPLQGWAQLNSAQGILIRNYRSLESTPLTFITQADPLIDALVPPSLIWADSQCQLHRPSEIPATLITDFYLFSPSRPEHCTPAFPGSESRLSSLTLERWLRVRSASIWRCPNEELSTVCPRGIKASPPGEPYRGKILD